MTPFETGEAQRIVETLERAGVSRYRVGAMAVMFQHGGRTHVVSSRDEVLRLLFNLSHSAEIIRLRERAA